LEKVIVLISSGTTSKKTYFFFQNFEEDEFWKKTQKTFQKLAVFGEVIDLIMNFQN
jgi:hypothetical protein